MGLAVPLLVWCWSFGGACEANGGGLLDDCGCKLDGVEIARCVSETLCYGFTTDAAVAEAQRCCGVSGLTHYHYTDITDGGDRKVGCIHSLQTDQRRDLAVWCSDDFNNY